MTFCKSKIVITISLLLLLFISHSAADEFVIIVNKSIETKQLKKIMLKRMFLGSKRMWNNGKAIVPVNLETKNVTRIAFNKTIFRKSSDDVERLYVKRALTGKSHPPKVLNSPQQVIAFVLNVDGAIGYIPKSMIPDNINTINIKP